jgi:hypothetical protein
MHPVEGATFDLRAVYDSPIRDYGLDVSLVVEMWAPQTSWSPRAGAPATVPGQLSAVTAALLSWPLSCAK